MTPGRFELRQAKTWPGWALATGACLAGCLLLALFGEVGSLPVSAADAVPLRQRIDAEIRAAWEREGIAPAPPAGDAEFLRRVSLDLVGVIPSADEAAAFLDDADADKRAKKIEQLLADPRFARHQADIWDMVLFGRRPPGYETDRRDGFRTWLASRFEQNVPFDAWAGELLRAEGNSIDNGALYYAQWRNAPEDAAEAVSQTFLGVQLQCARCHDHPYEPWTQLDFFGMAAFLARLEVVNVGKRDNLNIYAIGEKSTGDIRFTGPAKDAQPGAKGEPVGPKFLLSEPLEEPPLPEGFQEVKFAANQPPPPPQFSRKDALANWIVAADNPFFARAIANRIWAQYLGRGLVHPVDNLSPSNEPSHPALLAALAEEVKARGFDLRHLIRELVSSQTYQLSSAGSGEAWPQWFEHARSRPLSAEELAESWRLATGYADFENSPGQKPAAGRYRPLDGYLLRFFGSPNSGTGEFQGGLQEHLYLNNGPLTQMIGVRGGLAEQLGDKNQPLEPRIERLYLATLGRRPDSAEISRFEQFLSDGGSPVDAVWALITSSEFRFNH